MKPIKLVAVLLFTVLVLYLMMAPDTSPGIAEASLLLGGTEITDAIGHVILYALLTFAWYSVFAHRWGSKRGLYLSIVFIGLMSSFTELFQGIVPDRGMALLDLCANWLGVALFVLTRRMILTD